MTRQNPRDTGTRRDTGILTVTPQASVLPLCEQFLLWALRQWRCEIAEWETRKGLPAGPSLLQRGFDLAGLRQGLPHFAMVMDAVQCGVARPLEIHPPAAHIVGPDEGTLLALFGLAQYGLDGSLMACFSAILPPKNCAVATVQARLLGGLLNQTSFGSASVGGGCYIQ